jgi:hypothetical protein
MLATNASWALRGLIKIYERQTSNEQASGNTSELNSVGFSGCDAEILSSFATQYLSRGTLSPKQMVLVFKKLPRYSKQIISCIPVDKLPNVEQDALKYKNFLDKSVVVS